MDGLWDLPPNWFQVFGWAAKNAPFNFDGMAQGQGASMALPIWAIYMKKVLANPQLGYRSTDQFDVPDDFNPNEACE